MITIADLRAHDGPILALTMGGIRNNGKRYYPFDHRKLVALPERRDLLPSPKALEWHLANVFRRAS